MGGIRNRSSSLRQVSEEAKEPDSSVRAASIAVRMSSRSSATTGFPPDGRRPHRRSRVPGAGLNVDTLRPPMPARADDPGFPRVAFPRTRFTPVVNRDSSLGRHARCRLHSGRRSRPSSSPMSGTDHPAVSRLLPPVPPRLRRSHRPESRGDPSSPRTPTAHIGGSGVSSGSVRAAGECRDFRAEPTLRGSTGSWIVAIHLCEPPNL